MLIMQSQTFGVSGYWLVLVTSSIVSVFFSNKILFEISVLFTSLLVIRNSIIKPVILTMRPIALALPPKSLTLAMA